MFGNILDQIQNIYGRVFIFQLVIGKNAAKYLSTT